MFFALDENNNRVYINDARIKSKYFCPVCGQKLDIKRGTVRRAHFAHAKNSVCNDKWHYDMSDWHIYWQKFFPKKNREVVVQYNGEQHRADILINNTVIEFQHSSLSSFDFDARNNFYISAGYRIIWVFDVVEQFQNANIDWLDGSEEKFKWLHPKRTFDHFDYKNKNITIFFQMSGNITPDDHWEDSEISLLKIAWVSPGGFERFCAHEWFNENDFLNLFNLGKKSVANIKKEFTKDDVVDYLITYRRRSDDICRYYCPLRKDHSECFENCDCCKYNIAGDCGYRFSDINWDDVTEIKDIKRDREGRILKLVLEISNKIQTKNYPQLPTIARSIKDLWSLYDEIKVARFINIVKDYEVQIYCSHHDDFFSNLKKYKTCYGKIKYPGRDFSSKTYEIYDWDKPEWIIYWFK